MRKKRHQTTRNVTVVDAGLVRWLLAQGAPREGASHFGLSKGMGERIDLQVVDDETVELRFFGASHES